MPLASVTIDADRLAETAALFGSLLLTILALFLPIAFLVALARRALGEERLRRWLGGERTALAVAKGLALGAVTPFCGCSSVPVLAGLLQARVRFAAVTAFLMASPLLNPFVLAVVAVLFAPRAAVTYAVFAAAVAMVTALAWERLGLERWVRPRLRAAPITGGAGDPRLPAGGAGTTQATACAGDECGGGRTRVATPPADTSGPQWRGWRVESRDAAAEARELLRPMVLPILVGIAVGAMIYGAVPERLVTTAVAAAGPAAVPLAAALGIPLYLRGTTAFPIGAGLLAAGVPAGPMLAMVVAGMGASLPEVLLLRGLFTARLLGAFIATVFVVAITAGIVLPPWWGG